MYSKKERVYEVIREEEDKSLAGEIFDWVMLFLIVLNLAFLFMDTFTMPKWYKPVTDLVEMVTTLAFTIEYILRIWVAPVEFAALKPAKARVKYIFSLMAIVDLLSVIPFYLRFVLPFDLSVLRVFRFIRLMRIIKVTRYSEPIQTLLDVFKKKATQLLASLAIIFSLIMVASLLMYDLEHDAQPEAFSNAFSGLWWALETVTTIGIGDITPITSAGKVVGATIGLLGIGVVAVPTGIISAGFIMVMGANNDSGTAADEIAKYKQLLDENAITEEEYAEKKKQLLEPGE